MQNKTKKRSELVNLHIRLPREEKAAAIKAAEDKQFDLTTWLRLLIRENTRLGQ